MRPKSTIAFLAAVLILAGCTGGEKTSSTSAEPSVHAAETAETTLTKEDESDDVQEEVTYVSNDFNTGGVIEEQVIYDAGGIKITAKSLEYESSRAVLFMLIENDTSETYTIVTGSMGYSCNAVNGWMIPDGWFNEDVPAGKKSNVHSYYDFETMTSRGIHEIGLLQIGFDIHPEDDYSNGIYTGPIDIKTSLYDSWKDDDLTAPQLAGSYQEAAYDMDGDLNVLDDGQAYSNNGVVVTPIGFVDGDETKTLILEAENSSDQNLVVSVEDLSADGYSLSAGTWDSRYVNAGKKDIFDIEFYNSLTEDDWKAIGLSTVNDVEFSIQLKDEDFNEISALTPVKVHVSDAAGSGSSDVNQGEVLYSAHGITITNKGTAEDEYGTYVNWNLLVRNDNDFDLYITDGLSNTLSVGDYMVNYIMWGDYIGAGKTGIATIEINIDSLKENGIDPSSIGTVEIKLELHNESSYKTIDEPVITAVLS